MKFPGKNILLIALFFVSSVTLISYILLVAYHFSLPVEVFWISISLMVGIIIWQILISNHPKYVTGIILFEIITAGFIFHMIYFVQFYGLYGFDAYVNMVNTKAYLDYTSFSQIPLSMNGQYYWPILHALSASVCLITDMDLIIIAKWLPSIVDIALILGFYLLILRILNNYKGALLSALIIAGIQQHIEFSSLYVCETVGLVSAVFCLYFYLSARLSVNTIIFSVLAVVLLFITILGHHFTSFLLVVFIAIDLFILKGLRLDLFKKLYRVNYSPIPTSYSFLIISIVLLTSYWLYVNSQAFYTLAHFIESVFFPQQWNLPTYAQINNVTSEPLTTRGTILLYGFYIFHFIFAFILVYSLSPLFRNRYTQTYSLGVFALLCAFTAFLFLYIIPLNISALYPDRLITYFWVFAAGPIMINMVSGNKLCRGCLVALIYVFLLFNIYMIPPSIINPAPETVPVGTTQEDYALATTLDFNGSIEGQMQQLMAVLDTQNKLGSDSTFENGAMAGSRDLFNYDMIIVSRKWLMEQEKLPAQYVRVPQVVDTLGSLLSTYPPNVNKIYSSTDLSVFELNVSGENK